MFVSTSTRTTVRGYRRLNGRRPDGSWSTLAGSSASAYHLSVHDGRPNFFIVGAAKAGTSTLHDCFGRHPQIFMSALKEPNYFAEDLDLPYRVSDADEYCAMFEAGRDRPVRGESSASYLLSERAAENIRRFAPEGRVLISLRNPVDSFISHHVEARRWGTEPRRDVNQALREFLEAPAGSTRRQGPPYDRILRYAEQVERYLEVFPPDSLRVVLFEEWTSDPDLVLGSILAFLHVEPIDVPPVRQIRPAQQFRSTALQRLIMTGPGWLRPTPERRVRRRTLELLYRANRDPRPTPPVDLELRRQLTEYVAPEVDRLRSLLGRDLPSWGTDPSSGRPA